MKLKPIRRSLGVLLLIDGLRLLLAPDAYVRKLQTGTPLLDDVLEYVSETPQITVPVAAAGIALGLWLTLG